MEPPRPSLYLEIEISECSDTEDLQVIRENRIGPAPQATTRPTKSRVNRGKKNEIYIKGNQTIRSRFKNLDLPAIYDELNKIMAEYKRNVRSYEGKGTPLSVLQAIDFLNTEFVQGKADIDAKRKKTMSKEINQIKKIVSAAFAEFEEEIAKLKTEIDFSKPEEMTDEVEAEAEAQTVAAAADAPAAYRPAEEKERKRKGEEEEVDFGKRLTMNKEDRRKFWLVTKKVEKTDEKVVDRTTRVPGRTRAKPTGKKAAVQADATQIEGFSLTPDSLKAFLKEVYARRGGAERETLEKDVQQLDYALENMADDQLRGELYLLSLQQQIELLRDEPLPEPDSLDHCLNTLKAFLELIKGRNVSITNYKREDYPVYSDIELLKQLNSVVNQLTEEIEVCIKLSDPFDRNLATRLLQEIELIDFLIDYEEYVEGLPEEAAGAIHLQVCAQIIQLIHHISDDFVFSCKPLSEIFENQSISETVREYAETVYQKSKVDKLTARVRLCHAFNMAINLQDITAAHQHLTEAQKLGVTLTSDKHLVALFNRAIAQFGVASFKKHNLDGCKFYLYELLSAENTEALLSQYSVTRERVLDLPDPLSNFPYHMHINLEEARAAFLIASILTEASRTVLFQENLGASAANKVLVAFLESHHASLFVNSPRNISDQIFAFCSKIVQTDAESARRQLDGVKYFSQLEGFADFIAQETRRESLNCYLERIKSQPRTALSVDDLSHLFGIGKDDLVKALSDRIGAGDLQARFDAAKSVVHFNSGLRSIVKGEKEYEILESLRNFSQLNEKIAGAKASGEGKKGGSKAFDIFQFVNKKFDAVEKSFHFNYDFAFFKRQAA